MPTRGVQCHDVRAMNESEAIALARRALGRQLSQLRRRAGMTQQQLADTVLYSRTTVASVETGRQQVDRAFWVHAETTLAAVGALLAGYDAVERLIQERDTARATAAHRRRYGATIAIPARLPDTEDVNRRELLRMLTMAGAALAVPSIAIDGPQMRAIDGGSLDDNEQLNAHLWQVFALSRSKELAMPLVREQLNVLTEGLAKPQSPAGRERLCTQAADLFQLAGEIFFDQNRYTDAAHCYTLAASAAKETTAWDHWACALVRHAFIHLYERQFDKATPMLSLAARVADRGDQQLPTRHWVAAVQAQALAGLGDLAATQRALDLAEHVTTLPRPVPQSGWLRFDDSRLPEERGAAYVELRRPDLAEPVLIDALTQHVSARRRGAILADLAITGAQRQDPDQVLDYADQALNVAGQTGSGYVSRKLQALPAHLGPLLTDHRIDTLNRRLTT